MTMRPRAIVALVTATLAAAFVASFVRVERQCPRVHVRWAETTTGDERHSAEVRYSLKDAERRDGTTWAYRLEDSSRENLRALVSDPNVADTHGLDRHAFVADEPCTHRLARRPLLTGVLPPSGSELRPGWQSPLIVAFGLFVLWIAGRPDSSRRRAALVASVVALLAAAWTMPFDPTFQRRMGDYNTYVASREAFDSYTAVATVRFEAHLSHVVLNALGRLLGGRNDAPVRAFAVISAAGGAAFAAALLSVVALHRWSEEAVRYVALVILAPATLMYFGFREIGYLSLPFAVLGAPLVLRGVETGSRRVAAGASILGLGAAFHGFGLLSLGGAAAAALASAHPWRQRLALLLDAFAFGTAFYLVWVFVYEVLLKLGIQPGHAQEIALRPLLHAERAARVNYPIISAIGLRDVLMSSWIVGVPVVLAAGARVRALPPALLRVAVAFTVPSLVFLVLFWPVQGLAAEMDLVFAAFPALFALLWVAAHDPRSAVFTAGILLTGHFAFWRVILDDRFLNQFVR